MPWVFGSVGGSLAIPTALQIAAFCAGLLAEVVWSLDWEDHAMPSCWLDATAEWQLCPSMV